MFKFLYAIAYLQLPTIQGSIVQELTICPG